MSRTEYRLRDLGGKALFSIRDGGSRVLAAPRKRSTSGSVSDPGGRRQYISTPSRKAPLEEAPQVGVTATSKLLPAVSIVPPAERPIQPPVAALKSPVAVRSAADSTWIAPPALPVAS